MGPRASAAAAATTGRIWQWNLVPVVVVDGAGAGCVPRCHRRRILRDGHQLGCDVPSVLLLHHVKPQARCRPRRRRRRRKPARRPLRVVRRAQAVIGAVVVALCRRSGRGGIHRDLGRRRGSAF